MSKRAEQKADERWPIHPWTILPKEGEHGEITNFDEWLDDYRIWVQSFSANRGYKEGYEQAEKDLALTWEDIQTIIEIFYGLNKEIRDENFGIEKYGTKKYFTEILNRFNKSKEKE